MDEVTGRIRKQPYGEKERNSFLQWLNASVADAKAYWDQMEEGSVEISKYAAEQYYDQLVDIADTENTYDSLFSSDEKDLTPEDREKDLLEFRDRLLVARERITEWADSVHFPEVLMQPSKGFVRKLDSELSALDETVAWLKNPTAEAAPEEKTAPEVREDAPQAEENILDDSDDFSVHDAPLEVNTEPDELDVNVPEEKPVDTAESDALIAQQRKSVLQCARLLKNSKTLVNSKEYTNLIGLMEKVGAGQTAPIEGKTKKEQFAQELYAIHVLTEKYLDHKARDGVKKNAYRKLVAVNKTNDMLARCIDALGDVKVSAVDGTVKGLGDLPISFDARQMRAGTSFKPVGDSNTRAIKLKSKDASLEKVDTHVIAECIRGVDVCMCEIIMKAPDEKAKASLTAVRESFLEEPFPPVKDAVETTLQTQSVSKGKVL